MPRCSPPFRSRACPLRSVGPSSTTSLRAQPRRQHIHHPRPPRRGAPGQVAMLGGRRRRQHQGEAAPVLEPPGSQDAPGRGRVRPVLVSGRDGEAAHLGHPGALTAITGKHAGPTARRLSRVGPGSGPGAIGLAGPELDSLVRVPGGLVGWTFSKGSRLTDQRIEQVANTGGLGRPLSSPWAKLIVWTTRSPISSFLQPGRETAAALLPETSCLLASRPVVGSSRRHSEPPVPPRRADEPSGPRSSSLAAARA